MFRHLETITQKSESLSDHPLYEKLIPTSPTKIYAKFRIPILLLLGNPSFSGSRPRSQNLYSHIPRHHGCQWRFLDWFVEKFVYDSTSSEPLCHPTNTKRGLGLRREKQTDHWFIYRSNDIVETDVLHDLTSHKSVECSKPQTIRNVYSVRLFLGILFQRSSTLVSFVTRPRCSITFSIHLSSIPQLTYNLPQS